MKGGFSGLRGVIASRPDVVGGRPRGARTFIGGPAGEKLIAMLIQLALRNLPKIGAPFLIFVLSRIVPIAAGLLAVAWIYLLLSGFLFHLFSLLLFLIACWRLCVLCQRYL